jgi:NlpC/P60 family putative phage cell wall peptidase
MDILAHARAWIGTPFHHQGTVKGVGCDCRGLVVGVAAELGYCTQVETNYGRYPTGNKLVEVCKQYMEQVPLDEAVPGDVVVITFEKDPQHVAFVGDYPEGGLSLVHSLAGIGVVEHRLDSIWLRRITAAFRIPVIK